MGLADVNQLIKCSIKEASALFLERGAKPAPVQAQAIGPLGPKGTHHIVVVIDDPVLQRITVDLEVALQANGVGSDPKHLFRTVQRGTQQRCISRQVDAIAMPMQHQAAALLPLQQGLIARIRDPVDRAEAQFLQMLWWCSNLQGFHAASCSNSQELSPQADAQHRPALLVPGRQPVQFLPQPVHARLVVIVHAHRSPQHQRNAVRTRPGVRQGVAPVGPQGLEGQAPLPRQFSHQCSVFVVNVLDHQQRGAQSSR